MTEVAFEEPPQHYSPESKIRFHEMRMREHDRSRKNYDNLDPPDTYLRRLHQEARDKHRSCLFRLRGEAGHYARAKNGTGDREALRPHQFAAAAATALGLLLAVAAPAGAQTAQRDQDWRMRQNNDRHVERSYEQRERNVQAEQRRMHDLSRDTRVDRAIERRRTPATGGGAWDDAFRDRR